MTQDKLKEYLEYYPETGLFVWKKVNKVNQRKVGDIAGSLRKDDGYISIMVSGKAYKATHLAHLYMTGELPTLYMDHINGVRNDNRWSNLRQVTMQVNNHNQRKPRKDNKTGYLGVSSFGSKFRACIRVNSKRIHLGLFPSPEEAYETYLVARRQLLEGNTL